MAIDPRPWLALAGRCLAEGMLDWRNAFQRLLFQPLIYLLAFGGLLSPLGDVTRPAVVAPGIVTIVVMNAALAVVGGMMSTGYYFRVMEAWLLIPVSRGGFVAALVGGATAMATLAGIAAMVLIRLVLGLGPAQPGLALAAVVFGGAVFALVFVVGFTVPRTPDRAQDILSYVLLPMMFLGCTFYSWDSLAWPWNLLALAMPTTYLAEVLRATYAGVSGMSAMVLVPGAASVLALLGLAARQAFLRRFRDYPW
ncbi:MAG TPA: ABC transporter permease [Magnetospirillum sp.]|nr:ABC transporter permease [Magnetospirillum sp.]